MTAVQDSGHETISLSLSRFVLAFVSLLYGFREYLVLFRVCDELYRRTDILTQGNSSPFIVYDFVIISGFNFSFSSA
jgi:hypothetical protein